MCVFVAIDAVEDVPKNPPGGGDGGFHDEDGHCYQEKTS